MTKLKGILSQEPQLTGCLSGEPSISVVMTNGARGLSAYEVWLRQGNVGTENDFLESLKAQEVNYEFLENKPRIENVELTGNKTFEELGFTSIEHTDISNLL